MRISAILSRILTISRFWSVVSQNSQAICFLSWTFLQPFMAQRNMNPYLLLLWITAYHQNSFLTKQVTPPHRAVRSWTQLLIAGRLNLVCHQIPVGGRDGDVVQRATRPPYGLRLTPTEASSRKWQQKFALKPEASPLSALSLLLSGENWLGGNLNTPRCSTQNENVSSFFVLGRVIRHHLCFPLTHLWFLLAHAWHWWVKNHVVSQ